MTITPDPVPRTTRDLSLDLLKAFSIFMVVFFHNARLTAGSLPDNLSMLLPMAAVPCFFMASGAVFFHRPFEMTKHIRRMIRFYLTIVLWKLLYLVFYHAQGAPLDGSLRTLFSYLFLFQHMGGVGTAHFWFMDAMLTLMLAAPILYLCYHQKGKSRLLPGHDTLFLFLLAVLFFFNQLVTSGNLIAAGLAGLIGKPGWDLTPLGEVNPFSFRYSNYFTYYLLGGLLMEYKARCSSRLAAGLSLAGLLGLLMIKFTQTGSLVWDGIHLLSGYYWISTMLLASGLFLLFTRIPTGRISVLSFLARYAGGATLGIFYLHIPLIFLLTPRLFEPYFPAQGWASNLLESSLIVLISCTITWLWKGAAGIKSSLSRGH